MVTHTKLGVWGTTAKVRYAGVIHSFFNKCGKNAIRGTPSPLEKCSILCRPDEEHTLAYGRIEEQEKTLTG